MCMLWFLQVDAQKLRRDLETIERIIKIRDSNNTKFPVSSFLLLPLLNTSSLHCIDLCVLTLCVCVIRPQSLEVTSCAQSI